MSTVEISDTSRDLLHELSARTGNTAAEIVDKALAAYRRQVFFDQMNVGYAEMRADHESWTALEAERKQLDATLMDGLDPSEHWTDDGRCLSAPSNDGES